MKKFRDDLLVILETHGWTAKDSIFEGKTEHRLFVKYYSNNLGADIITIEVVMGDTEVYQIIKHDNLWLCETADLPEQEITCSHEEYQPRWGMKAVDVVSDIDDNLAKPNNEIAESLKSSLCHCDEGYYYKPVI